MAELAFQIPLMMVLLFGAVEIGRVFYVYHALQKAVRGGASLLARTGNVDYCTTTDLTMQDVRNFIVYGNLQGEGTPIVRGLTADMIQIFAERLSSDSTDVTACPCDGDAGDPDTCNVANGGRAPDFVVINLGSGFPLEVPFPFVSIGTFNLNVSVRMPVTGG